MTVATNAATAAIAKSVAFGDACNCQPTAAASSGQAAAPSEVVARDSLGFAS
jgi:hypothetical protein